MRTESSRRKQPYWVLLHADQLLLSLSTCIMKHHKNRIALGGGGPFRTLVLQAAIFVNSVVAVIPISVVVRQNTRKRHNISFSSLLNLSVGPNASNINVMTSWNCNAGTNNNVIDLQLQNSSSVFDIPKRNSQPSAYHIAPLLIISQGAFADVLFRPLVKIFCLIMFFR